MSVERIAGNVGGRLVTVSASFARPGDTTAYTAGDVVSNNATTTVPMTFALALSRNEGSGYVIKAKLSTDQSTFVARLRLWLFTVSTMTVAADNAAGKRIYADRSSLIGYIDFPAAATGAGTSTGAFAQITDVRLGFNGAAATQAIYGYLEALDVFTPANAQNFQVDLSIDQN